MLCGFALVLSDYIVVVVVVVVVVVITIIISSISNIFKYRKLCGMSVSSTLGLRNSCIEVSTVLVLQKSRKYNESFLGPGHRCMVKR